ncbi:hypothetical protein DXG01_014152, partial [Tephrocybe rancida]
SLQRQRVRSLAQSVGLHLAPMLKMKRSSCLVCCRKGSPIAQRKILIRLPLLSLAHRLFCHLVAHLQTPTTPTRLLRPRLRNLVDLLLPLCDFRPHSRPSFVIQAARPAGPTLSLRRLQNSWPSLECAQRSIPSRRNLWTRKMSRSSKRKPRRRNSTPNSRKGRRARASKATPKVLSSLDPSPTKQNNAPSPFVLLLRSRYRTLPQKSAKHRSYSSRSWVKVPYFPVVLQPDGAPTKHGMEFTEKLRRPKIVCS